jgi:hypothetical protein
MRKRIKIEVYAESCYNDENGITTVHVKTPDTEMKIFEGERIVGSIAGCVGADIDLAYRGLPGFSGYFSIHPIDLWNAFQVALCKAGAISKSEIKKIKRDAKNRGIDEHAN